MTEPNRQSGENEERIIEIEIERLRPFKEHPFQVKDDKEMFLLQESIEKYAIVADSSGKHNGESRISHRGRKRLRYALYEAAISVIGKNKEFKEIHHYYRTREKNPLKKMQSVIAVACKLIRTFYTILTKGIDYDGQKMLKDIVRPGMQSAA
mgnify:CR=1 FL=1